MMMLFTVLVIALVVLVPDFYIYFTFLHHQPLLWRVLWWFPLFFLVAMLLAQGLGWGYSFPLRAFFLMLTCVVLPKFLFALVSLVGKLMGVAYAPAFRVGNGLAGMLALLTFAACLYGALYGWKKLVYNEQTLTFNNLPAAFQGYKVIQISDLHVGTYAQEPDHFQKMVQLINEQEPDLVVFTGDIVNSSPVELEPFAEILKGIRAKDGVLSVVGNHDYCTYGVGASPKEKEQMFQRVVAYEKSFGWQVLMNENKVIRRGNDSIAILGVENVGRPPFPSKGDLKKAQNGLSDQCFKILLSHDPTHWRRETLPDTDIPLQLSGHTHAMQFKVLGWSPSSFTYTEWGGLYEENGQKLFISTGAGGNVPFRVGAWPEIVVLNLSGK